jgi:hypothetical protein
MFDSLVGSVLTTDDPTLDGGWSELRFSVDQKPVDTSNSSANPSSQRTPSNEERFTKLEGQVGPKTAEDRCG